MQKNKYKTPATSGLEGKHYTPQTNTRTRTGKNDKTLRTPQECSAERSPKHLTAGKRR